MSDWKERVYPALPVRLQSVVCWAYGVRHARTRFNRKFERILGDLLESEWWDRGKIADYKDEKVRSLVGAAYASVPFYRELMQARGLGPNDIRTVEDLSKLPVLTKETVRARSREMVSEKVALRTLEHRHTSGTTGKSLHFWASRELTPFHWAVWWRHRMRFGLRYGAPHVNFTGKLVVPPAQSEPPYWRECRPLAQLLLNMHHLVPEKIGAIVDHLDRWPAEFYSGYPSVLHAFALACLSVGRRLSAPPRVIVTGAENLLEQQRRDLTALTGAILTDQYGFSEGCGNASQCPEGHYHEDFEFGVIECVDGWTDSVGRRHGKVVCTGFGSVEAPFIRYEVGDEAVWENPDVSCSCGRRTPFLVSIQGRSDDYVLTPEGRRIMRFDYIFKDTLSVQECQVVQRSLGEVALRIVRRPFYTSKDEEHIRGKVGKWISPRLVVVFEYVEALEREPNGKLRAVKSLLRPSAEEAEGSNRAST